MMIQIYEVMLPWKRWVNSISSQKVLFLDSLFLFWTAFNMKFWIVKWENVNENGPAGIEVVRVFCPNLVCSCFGPQVVNLWKGLPRLVWNWPYTTWPVVCRIVNWKGLTAYNVTSPLKIWTKFGVWLPLRLCGPPSKEENFIVSIIFFIEWTSKQTSRKLLQLTRHFCTFVGI